MDVAARAPSQVNPSKTLSRALGGAGGVVLGAAFGAVALLRRSKPLHPLGTLREGILTVEPGLLPNTGSPFLDQPGSHRCVVRLSRSTGLPEPLPDIQGLAVRLDQVAGTAGTVDVLFASTGLGRVTRHVLVLRREPGDGALSTLLPVSSPSGPVLLALVPVPGSGRGVPSRFSLLRSRPGGPWHECGSLTVDGPAAGTDDPPLRFDPVLNPAPGLPHYRLVGLLRAGAYAGARLGYRRGAGTVTQR